MPDGCNIHEEKARTNVKFLLERVCGRTEVCIIVRTAALAAVLASVLASVFVAVLVAAATRAAETLTPVPSRRSQTSAAQGASVSRIAVLALTTHGGTLGVLTTAVARSEEERQASAQRPLCASTTLPPQCPSMSRRWPNGVAWMAALARLPRWRWPMCACCPQPHYPQPCSPLACSPLCARRDRGLQSHRRRSWGGWR